MGLQIVVIHTAYRNNIKVYFPIEVSFTIKIFYFFEYIFGCLAILALDIK